MKTAYSDIFTIIKVVDNLILSEPFKNNATVKSLKTPQFIKHKLNLRKRLLKSWD